MILPLVEPLSFLEGLDPPLPWYLVNVRAKTSSAAKKVEEAKMLDEMLLLTRSANSKIDMTEGTWFPDKT